MRILLTGHKGFLGSEIYEVLTKENAHNVDGRDSNSYPAFEVYFADTDFQVYDLVIHCGAVSNSEETGNRLWQLNYQASCQIARACEHANTKLLFISSAAAIAPDTPYGWSKHCAEFYMQQQVAGMNLCILRPFNIWAFDESGKQHLSIVYKILTGQLREVYWNCQRDFIYISDVVSAVQQVVHDWTPGTFDIGTAEPTDISTLVNLLHKDTGIPKPPVISECPVNDYVVARKEHLLPNWGPADSISEHLSYLSQQMNGGLIP